MEDDWTDKNEEVKQIKRDLINYGKSKWGKEWIHSILKIGRPYRMQRGIEYAKDSQRIENLLINKGRIFATVQGTAPSPYRVSVNFELIPEERWKIIIDDLASKAINIIELLEGNLPEDIINIFEKAQFPLFIDAQKGLDAKCSCPDKAVPCKHIAATILYLARVIDYDPFILLKLRGKSKKDLLSHLSLAKKSEVKEKLIQSQELDFSFSIPKMSIDDILSENKTLSESPQFGFKFKKPGKIIETLENLGLPRNLDNPKSFATVLNSIYQTVTKQIYSMAINLEKSNKKR